MLPHCPALLSSFSVHLLLLTLGKYMMMMMMMMMINGCLLPPAGAKFSDDLVHGRFQSAAGGVTECL